MKLIFARVMPLLLALLVPSFALAATPAAGHKPRAGQTSKRVKAKQPKPSKVKAPKAMKKAPKALKAPRAAKKAPKAH